MLNCPRCGEDYSETGLAHGRCRRCGHVVNTFITMTAVVPSGKLEATPEEQPVVSPATPLSSPSTQIDSLPQPPQTSKNLGTVQVATMDETIVTSEPAAVRLPVPVDFEQWVVETWGGQIDDVSMATQTVKVGTEDDEVSHRLTVPRRGVRSGEESPGGRHDYELLEFIARGAEGMVHEARQASLDRTVAMKMIRKERAGEKLARQKFMTEAVITGSLEHPNIVPIHDLGTTNDGTLFYVMKRIRGTPWSEVIRECSVSENLNTLMRVADAVGLAHSQGVIHRDLKPENVMLGDFGEVLLTDWGIALCTEAFEKAHQLSSSHSLGGTPAYMAPEMVTGPIEKVGPAADIYLLGAILFEIVSGAPPHCGETVMDCLLAAARNEIRKVDATGELVEIARRAMATDPELRFSSVREFQAAMRLYQSHSESVLLSDRAKQDLDRAREFETYDAFSAAVFGFQKAIELWPENRRATNLLVVARSEYAAAALNKGDLDLAASQLDMGERKHHALIKRMVTAQRERDTRHHRLKQLKRLAALLLIGTLVGGGISVVSINRARRVAEASERKALADKIELQSSQDTLEKTNQNLSETVAALDTQKSIAEDSAALAQRERERSEVARQAATDALRQAREASYVFSVALAGNSIANNAFDDAYAVLRQQQANPDSSWLRHWEWGRQMYLCLGGDPNSKRGVAVKNLPIGGSTEALTSLAVAVSQGGDRMLAAPTLSGKILVWEQAGSGPRDVWENPQIIDGDVMLHAVAFSSDGSYLAAAGADGIIRVHRTDRLDLPPQRLVGHRRDVLAIDFSPQSDSPWLVSASADRSIKLWRVDQADVVRTLVGHSDSIRSVAFSPDGQRLVSASEDFTARVWDVSSGAELQRFAGHQEPVFCARFSPDGRWVASGGYDERVLVWAADRFQPIEAELLQQVSERLEGGGNDADATSFRSLLGHTAAVLDVDFSPDGSRIVSASRDNTVRVWNFATLLTTDGKGVGDGKRSTPAGVLAPEQSLRGHGGWVSGCRFLGQDEIVTGAYDHRLKVWNWAQYREVDTIPTLGRPILSASYSPDGQQVALAFNDGTAGIWDKATGEQVGELEEGHEYLTANALFMPEGERLITIAGDDTLRMWDVEKGSEIWAVEGTGRRGLLAISPDGTRLATGSRDGKIARIWGAERGQLLGDLDMGLTAELVDRYPQASAREIARQVPDVTALTFSPDGTRVATADSSGRCFVWPLLPSSQPDRPEPTLRFHGHERPVTALLWLDEQNQIVTGSADGSIAFWNSQTGEEIPGRRLYHGGPLSLLAVSQDGSAALSVATDGTSGQRLHHWDLERRELISKTAIPGQSIPGSRDSDRGDVESRTVIGSIAFAPEQSEALVATFDPDVSKYAVWKWDLREPTAKPVRQRDLRAGLVFSARYDSAQTRRMVTTGGSGARLWDRLESRELMNYQPHGAVLSIDYAPDGHRVVTVGSDRSVKIWFRADADGRWGSEEKLIGEHVGAVTVAKFVQHDGRLGIVSGGEDGRAVWWARGQDGWKREGEWEAHAEPIRQIAVSPDGRLVATAAEDTEVRVWNHADRSLVHALKDHRGPVRGLAFSRDSRKLVSGGSDNQAVVWELATGEPSMRLVGHSAPISAVGFSPDGWRVITGSDDGTIKLWDVRSVSRGERREISELLSVRGHSREVTDVEFDPSGKQILSVARDGRALLWNSVDIEPVIWPRVARLTYRPGQPPLALLKQAQSMLKFPTSDRFGGWKLVVRLPDSEPLAGERIEILEPGPVASRWQRTDGRMMWSDAESANSETALAEVRELTSPTGVSIELSDEVSPARLNELLDLIGYRCDPFEADLSSGVTIRPIDVSLQRIDSDLPPVVRTISIELDQKAPVSGAE